MKETGIVCGPQAQRVKVSGCEPSTRYQQRAGDLGAAGPSLQLIREQSRRKWALGLQVHAEGKQAPGRSSEHPSPQETQGPDSGHGLCVSPAWRPRGVAVHPLSYSPIAKGEASTLGSVFTISTLETELNSSQQINKDSSELCCNSRQEMYENYFPVKSSIFPFTASNL